MENQKIEKLLTSPPPFIYLLYRRRPYDSWKLKNYSQHNPPPIFIYYIADGLMMVENWGGVYHHEGIHTDMLWNPGREPTGLQLGV